MCFHGETLVLKEDGSEGKMRDLAAGDRILVSGEDHSTVKWSTVLAVDVYQQYNAKKPVEYLEIHTSSSMLPLHITPSHSLLVKRDGDVRPQYVFAHQALVGDSIYMLSDGTTTLGAVNITEIRKTVFYDAYAPLTFEGNLIVNRIVVSTYGTLQHELAHHLIKAPRRWYLYMRLVWFNKRMLSEWMTIALSSLHFV